MTDIVARLRHGAISYISDSGPVYAGPTVLEREAAERIAKLEAENARLKQSLSEQIDRDISGIFPAEALSRVGGVKVRDKEELSQLIFDVLSECHYDASNSTRADRVAVALSALELAARDTNPVVFHEAVNGGDKPRGLDAVLGKPEPYGNLLKPAAPEGQPHPMGPKQTIIHEVWQRLEGPYGLMRNVDRSIIEKGVESALYILRREGVTLSAPEGRQDDEPVAWRVTYASGEVVFLSDKPVGDSGVYECEPLFARPVYPTGRWSDYFDNIRDAIDGCQDADWDSEQAAKSVIRTLDYLNLAPTRPAEQAVTEAMNEMRDLVRRARAIIPDFYKNWHRDAGKVT